MLMHSFEKGEMGYVDDNINKIISFFILKNDNFDRALMTVLWWRDVQNDRCEKNPTQPTEIPNKYFC